jgi:thymidylate synthase ThyX
LLSPLAQVYALSQFSEEVKAMAMAKCSRSPNTFMADALAATEEKAADFHDRVHAYGHESVADCAIGSLCFENISILAGEALVDLQTGKYQGKSSRYVVYNRERVVQPFVDAEGFGQARDFEAWPVYNAGITALFDAYEALQAPVTTWVEAQPEMVGLSKPVIRARVLDALRGLLPLGALTNFGTRLSSRDTAELIRQFLASPHAELRQLAELMRAPAMEETPTLVRHAVFNPLYQTVKNILPAPRKPLAAYDPAPVRLIKTWGGLADVVEMMTLEQSGAWVDYVWDDDNTEEEDAIDAYKAARKLRFDPAPHAFRAVRCRFEIEADFGVWKDLRRHRRCELFRAPFTAALGYEVPDDIQAIGGVVAAHYSIAMQSAADTYTQLVALGFAHEAEYVVAQGHTQRWVMDMDLEQLIYLTELRTQPGGHISYRRVARQMYDLAAERFPELLRHALVHEVDGVTAHH